jgi:hypothetical protein
MAQYNRNNWHHIPGIGGTMATGLSNERSPFSFLIDNLGVKTCIIKVKKIACKSLKGRGVNSGLRLIYAYLLSR